MRDSGYIPTIRLIRSGMVRAVNGNDPHNMAYNNTPQLQTSTNGPSYSLPVNTSGAAYCYCYHPSSHHTSFNCDGQEAVGHYIHVVNHTVFEE
jgi:hypothetical protein